MLDRKPRVGVFGLGRGSAYAKLAKAAGIEIVAACDKDISKFANIKSIVEPGATFYTDFDKFIEHDMDAVILCNYFNNHTPFVIKAMKAGKDVLSETQAASNLKECVELCEIVEQTGRKYMLAENYPFMKGSAEMTRVYRSGILGDVVFAEGEYVHPISPDEQLKLSPGENHWRMHNPRIYYLTHSLAPIMMATDVMPVRVNAETVYLKDDAFETWDKIEHKPTVECAGMMLLQMSNGSVFRISGSNNLAPHGNWYRLACSNGSIETVRGDIGKVMIDFGTWDLPVGVTESHQCYDAHWAELNDVAEKAGHGGGDFWVMYNFMKYLRYDEKPYFDVYNSVMLSSTAIMAYRSALAEGMPFDIPDFRNKEIRDQYRNDTFVPFPDYVTGEGKTLPSNAHQFIFEKDLAEREATKTEGGAQ